MSIGNSILAGYAESPGLVDRKETARLLTSQPPGSNLLRGIAEVHLQFQRLRGVIRVIEREC